MATIKLQLNEDEAEVLLQTIEETIENKYQWLADWGETNNYEKILKSDGQITRKIKIEIAYLEALKDQLRI